MDSIVSNAALSRHEHHPVAQGERLCPSCNMSPVSSFKLLPMEIDDLDQAVALRKKTAADKAAKKCNASKDNGMGQGFADAQAEASYLLLSHGGASGSLSAENEYQRTGRWTEEEVVYADFLVEAFDSGRLPIEHGMKLSDFLGEVLLCKSSRLTKKMKNAKLSVRSYEFRYPLPGLDVQMLSTLEQKFLQSITSEPSRLELRFNLTRMWRSRLSNLCLQVGSTLLDATDWIISLEDMERRATQAEETIRSARRKRMGLALRKDVQAGKDGVFFAGVPVQRPPKRVKGPTDNLDEAASGKSVTDTSTNSDGGDTSEADFISGMLDLGESAHHPTEDFTQIFDDLANGPGLPQGAKHMRNNCGPFLEEIVSYAETHNLPFQHVDVWVPSYTNMGEGPDNLRLFHAGHATRSDIDAPLFGQLNEYGEYSTKFSFASGVGLPGRVFAGGESRWEQQVDEADPKFFERAGGAKVYGVKTGFGFPLTTKVIGRIVVCFYSVVDVPEDDGLKTQCVTDLAKLCPEPKWKLVVEMETDAKPAAAVSAESRPSTIHYRRWSSPKHDSSSGDVMDVDYAARIRSDDASSNSGSTPRSTIDDEALIDHRIASLLGDHMPLAELPSPGCPSSAPSVLVPQFMSLRLVLLRSASRRSVEENDLIDVIRKSFMGYTRDARRTEKELAFLLVKDWQFLRSSMQPAHPPPAQTSPQMSSSVYQSHVMDIPSLNNSGAVTPVVMPKPLAFLNPTVVRRGSLEN